MNSFLSSALNSLDTSGLWLVDSAIKCSALLLIAGLVAQVMRRDSAAARHIVWLVAIVAVLCVPLLSAALPSWRVLPAWASMTRTSSSFTVAQATQPVGDVEPIAITPDVPTKPLPNAMDLRPKLDAASDINPVSEVPNQPNGSQALIDENGINPVGGSLLQRSLAAVPWIWVTGVGLLLVRLLAARVLLWRIRRESLMIERNVETVADRVLIEALENACKTLGVNRRVTLLVHAKKQIPMVWGIWRHSLLLPESARQWTESQLRAVLLHELAHLKRGDTLWQLIAQATCALHWFNPLVWLAAWRLHVERERACDDLVLGQGVRASEYAECLLDVATRLTGAHWTQAVGLAMARSSSLNGRVTAILNAKQCRRRVSPARLVLAILVSAIIAIPVAALKSNSEALAAEPALPGGAETNMPDPNQNTNELAAAANAPAAASNAPASIDSGLPEGLEQYLDWSEPVGGLRAAVMIRSAEGPGRAGRERKVYIVVQNVSDKNIRLCDTAIHETDIPQAETEGRQLYLTDRGEILLGMQNAKSAKIDMALSPREAIAIDMFDKEKAEEPGHSRGDSLSENIVKVPHHAMFIIFNIVHAPEGAWTGKLTTPTSRGAFAAEGRPMPSSKDGQALFRYCLDNARLNGEIPGGLLSRLHDLVKEFIELNTGDASGDSYAKKMQALLVRFEHKGDWKQKDVVALFDEIAAVTTIPLHRTMEKIRENTLQRGMRLAPSLNNANWGEALPGGLRMAWILEPRSDKQYLGSSLKSRIVLHNSGKEPAIFVTRSFHQPDHQAKTVDGTSVKTDSTLWTTVGRPEPYRLHPGESCELFAPGIGIGARSEKVDD